MTSTRDFAPKRYLNEPIDDIEVDGFEPFIDHANIMNIGTNSHAAIDTHIADATIHFTEASIDHTAIANIGTNSHAAIDTHIADTSIHYARTDNFVTSFVAGTQVIPNNATTGVTFNDTNQGTTDWIGTSGLFTTVTIDTAGYYHIRAHLQFSANATGMRTVYLEVNGGSASGTSNPGNGTRSTLCSADYEGLLAASDVVRVSCWQDSGTNRTIEAGNLSVRLVPTTSGYP